MLLCLSSCKQRPHPDHVEAITLQSATASSRPAATFVSASKDHPLRSTRIKPAHASEPDHVTQLLLAARIVALRPLGNPLEGHFEASLDLTEKIQASHTTSVPTLTWFARQRDPTAYKGPVAYYKLAKALGFRVVPTTVVRRLGIGQVATLVEQTEDSRWNPLQTRNDAAVVQPLKWLRSFSVMNDGTVDVLIMAPCSGPPGPRWTTPRQRILDLDSAYEFKSLARWSSSQTPLPQENTYLVRDYVEMLALDYLAGNVSRRSVTLDEDEQALILTDNAVAFPMHVGEHALDRVLNRLKVVERFPRSLRDALLRFNHDQATQLLTPGVFENWLVPPRTLVELEERRRTLVSLIEAKVSARGENAVLVLGE